MISNRLAEPYIASHRVLELAARPAANILPVAGIEALPMRSFTLDQHWRRGGYYSSLHADTNAASIAWRDDYLRDRLPMLPADRRGVPIEPQRFWPALARYNGEPEDVLQRRLQLDTVALAGAIDCAAAERLVATLPFWPMGEGARRPLIYMTDSGLWHRLFAGLPESGPFDERGEKLLNKAWEGFNIEALRNAAGSRAEAFVWRVDTVGEIDLILDWRAGERWAIEISISPNKKPSRGFWVGAQATGACRKIVVRPSNLEDFAVADVEYVALEGALLAVQAGPPG